MKQVGEYLITHTNIAKGAFASIHKGKHIYSDYIVAIKEIKLNGEPVKDYIKREIEIHQSLEHPNIVRVLDVIYDSASIYIIMEYCVYGDLQKFQNKKPFNHKHIQCYMLQLRDALQYLRSKNIVHRDLKPQNILLTSPLHIKITDFGLARYINLETELQAAAQVATTTEDLFSTYCGSPIYMSPELLNHQQYNSESDLWSLGIILYELITGIPPFIAKNIKQLVDRVNTEQINLDKIDKTLISEDCFNLLCSLLNRDKTRRVDWDEFFNHKWLSNNIMLEEENRLIENPLCYELLDNKHTHTDIKSNITNVVANAENVVSPLAPNNAESADSRIIINSTTSSSSALKFSDHLNINNSPKLERRHTSLDKSFTFSLKSSKISEIPTNQSGQINLSDLVQDDIAENTSANQHNNPSSNSYLPASNNITPSKPINIIGRHNRYTRTPPSSESGSSTSMQSNPNTAGNSAPTRGMVSAIAPSVLDGHMVSASPRGIMNALRFIKETYDYLSSDNKSL